MKCIEAIKPTKQIQVGTVKKINDIEADSMVMSGYWKYIPKSQYKKVKEPDVVISENTESVTKQKNQKNYQKTKKENYEKSL